MSFLWAVGWLVNTKIGQALSACLLIVAMFGTWLLKHDHKVRVTERKEIAQTSAKVGKQNNAKAQKAISAASQPGAAKRLLADPAGCRDCNK